MVENHFKKNRDIFGFESIAELIEEVMDSMEAAGIPLVEGGDSPALLTEAEGFSAARFFDSIFTPNMTEAVGEIGTPEREAFLKIMKKVQGDTLAAKLDSVRGFIAGDDAQTDKADKVLSYLTFLKTMAEVFQQYSPSGSGFLLEAFLAGLMKGRQIVDTEEGSLPIVDYTTEGGDPVSLKRLTGGEKKTPIKGSIKNLSAHIAKNPDRGVDYVVAAIHGAKDGGKIAFWEFNINADTFIEYVGKFIKVPPGTSFGAPSGDPAGALAEAESKEEMLARVAAQYPLRVGEIQKALGVNGTKKTPVLAGQDEATGQDLPALKSSLGEMRKLVQADAAGIATAAKKLAAQKKFIPELVNTSAGKAGADGFNAVWRTPEGIQRQWIAASSKEAALAKIQEAFPGIEPRSVRFYGQPGTSNVEQALLTLMELPDRGVASDQAPTGIPLDLPGKGDKSTPEGTPPEMTLIGAMAILQKAFRQAVGNLPPVGAHFSKGVGTHARRGGGKVDARSLAALPDEQKAQFPDWLRQNPAEFMDIINYTIGKGPKTPQPEALDERIARMLRESEEDMLLEAEEKDKTQFLITQQQMMQGTPGFLGTIDITRAHLLKVANKYNAVVKDRLSPIFISVDNLMGALQSFYVNNRIASGEKASTECEELKSNVDAEVTAAKATRKK
jgi:hypothetical protein